MELTITPTTAPKPKPPSEAQLGFGRYFTDHMFLYNYTPELGWHQPRIVPYAPLTLDPACVVLHYGQQTFEGLKAYRGVDGGVRLFRHMHHLERLSRSAARLCIPAFDKQAVGDALKQLVLLDRQWIPKSEGCSLYIRPNIIATDAVLGVRPSLGYLLYIILNPVGAYYPEGFNPVKIMVEEEHVRAIAGGVGEAKTGGNYAASLLGQMEAKKRGFTQVLWLDGKEHKYVEEVGTMNIFFVIGDEVITSPLTGSILHGVTRDSVLRILRDWGHHVSERLLSIHEVVAAAENGTLKEVFGTGTAAVVSPVGAFSFRGTMHTVGDGHTGQLSQQLYDYLLGIQYGKVKDPYGWTERIDL
ncbi:MAG: branched-chain amino acid aminotransferase [Deltaproteobacteria bacterium]|nr:branched-chain amino acid aminotransferase [Deltaproteobacteria bacterium]